MSRRFLKYASALLGCAIIVFAAVGAVHASGPTVAAAKCPNNFLCMPAGEQTSSCPSGYICMPSNLKIYTVQPNYVTSAGVAVTVRGAAFDSGSYVIFDGPNGTSIQPTSFSNSSLTFDMPQSTVGVHHIQIGEMSSNLPISPAYNVVMGENTVGSSPAPTARLTVNGLHARVLNVGDTIQLVWNAANADEYTSELASGGPSTCSSLPLSIQSAQGSLQYTIPEAYASCVWRLTFLAKNNTLGYQAAASDSVILYVRSLMRPAMAASNSSAH